MFFKINQFNRRCRLAYVLLLMSFAACAGYASQTRGARRFFNRGGFLAAAEEFNKYVSKTSNDQLLALLDTAISYHYAGQYQESIKYFRQADSLVERLDYLSLSRQMASFVATDYVLKYKGEDFEKVLINTYLAIDYLLLGDLENALVEAKRVNQRLQKYSEQCKCEYKLNPFSIYLSGIIYEMNRQPDEAFIDYKKVRELIPEFPLLEDDLQRTSRLAGIDYPKAGQPAMTNKAKHDLAGADYGELIVFFECGHSPEKHQESKVIAIPAYHKRPSRISYAKVYVDGQFYDRTYILNDIEDTAIQNLKDKMARMLAKQGIVTVGKVAIANQIGKQTKSPLAESLAFLFFYATNKADTRSWLTLPQNMQLARIPLPAGSHQVSLRLYDHNNIFVESVNFDKVSIKESDKHFINYRSVK